MLVPSTFTGWYRKMMMKAEMAREMMRSRSQTPNPELTRSADAAGGHLATSDAGTGLPISPAEPGSPELPIMLPYCIQNRYRKARFVFVR